MKTIIKIPAILAVLAILAVAACENNTETTTSKSEGKANQPNTGGYASQVEWGKHIVTISGCDDCHSPKVMTPQGPMPDESRRLSGHPAEGRIPDLVRDKLQSNGWGLTNEHLTAWAGPWGISFAANLTPDDTGIGSWTEEQFFIAVRKGKFKGMESSRSLLPPMPWPNYAQMSDDELKAVFAFLKSLKPVKNAVPNAMPPVGNGDMSAVNTNRN